MQDPILRKQLQGQLGIAVHEYKAILRPRSSPLPRPTHDACMQGLKTKFERELDGDANTSDSEEEDEELDDDDSEWDEWDWEWEEVWHETDGSTTEEEEEEPKPYVHSNKPRNTAAVRVAVSSPGPFHPPSPKKYGI